ncbi:hypothetical protein PAXINDRAFT_18020 [Paxillus involutus ATCC 200175]|uniref:Uncharacterized protein n=1 Tax=Paxillus involutus ATCC 200175 TaxID=664439 RepID=A0A0C9SPC9_PAXIN|nr:hypothetical protein PAXINDRAFT_18020 [Paxillus involutus ATCC 200175]
MLLQMRLMVSPKFHSRPSHRLLPGLATEMQALNSFLALEHMGNAFYDQSLARHRQDDFVQNVFPTWARSRWVEVAERQATYVSFLENVLGDEASFAELSYMLETIDRSAYSSAARYLDDKCVEPRVYLWVDSGAARYLDDKDLVSTFGSILAVKARYSAKVNSVIKDATDPTQILTLTLTSAFVVSCRTTQSTFVGSSKAFSKLSFPLSLQVTSDRGVRPCSQSILTGDP